MRLLAPLIVVALTAGPAHAAVTIVTQHGNGAATTIILDGDHVRIDNPGRGQHATAVIMDAAAKKLVTIDDQDKSYVEITEADRQRMKTRVDGMMAQMKERMKDMPPDQRKRMEEMMGRRGLGDDKAAPAPTVKFEPLGAKKTINGFACEMYRRLEDGKVREELCAAPWSSGVVQKSDFTGIQKFAAEMMEGFGPARARRNPLAEMDRYPGIPISRVSIDADGTRGEEDQIKSIKRGSVPAARFAVPEGYTKKELPLGRPGRGRPE
jgi:hypothetical protein